jgi:hypothetical protein
MRRLAALAVCALLAACGGNGSPPADEAVGVVDTSFGIQGVVALPGEGSVEDILELPDGSLLVAGTGGFVAKLTSWGTLDPTFAGGGIDASRHGNRPVQSTVALAPFPQAAVTVLGFNTSPCPGGGFCNPAAGEVVVRRIDANGAMDLAYGNAGHARRDGLTPVSQVVSPSGRVMTFALTGGRTETFFGVAAISAAGAPDAFGNDVPGVISACGRVVSPPGGFFRPDTVGAVAQGENTIVVAVWRGPTGGVCVIRFTPEGAYDATFSPGGFVTAKPSEAARSLAVARVMLRDDGVIVVALARLIGTTPPVFLFFRDGQLSEQAAPAAPSFMLETVLQPNGKVLMAGFPARSPDVRELPYDASQPQLWRASRDAATADTSFGAANSGFVPIASGTLLIEPRRVRVDRAGRILVGGRKMGTREPALIRFR